MCYTQKQNFQVGVLHTTHFWQHCDHYWVYCTHVLMKKAPGGLLFTTQQSSTAINNLVAYMHIKKTLERFKRILSLYFVYTLPTCHNYIYIYVHIIYYLYYHS